MLIANPHRGEVAFKLGERDLILALDWNAVAALSAMWPTEFEDDEKTLPKATWQTKLNDAFQRFDMESIALVLEAAAQRHHPDVKAADFGAASPPYAMAQRAVTDLCVLFDWGPGGVPKRDQDERPFDHLRTLLRRLSASVARSGSTRAPSGA